MSSAPLGRKIALPGGKASLEEAKIALLGIPLDTTSSYRPGSRFAPEEIRKVFEVLEDYSLDQRRSFFQGSFWDMGDVELPRGSVERELETAWSITFPLVQEGKKPLILGGEHTVTAAAVQPLLRSYPDLVVLQLDAHADLRPSYMEECWSHASIIYRLLEMGVKEVYQLGVRSATQEEMEQMEEASSRTCWYPHKVKDPLQELLPRLQEKPVYVTVDIDVVDPAFAPGTGTPEPGGITSAELLESLELMRGLELVGLDLVEVNPSHDREDLTSLLGAKILREAVMLLDA